MRLLPTLRGNSWQLRALRKCRAELNEPLIQFIFTAATCLLMCLPARADKPQVAPRTVIEWADLRPEGEFSDPYKELNEQQLQDAGYVSRVLYLLEEEKISPDSTAVQKANEMVERLSKAGVDVFWLLAQRRHVAKLRELQANTVKTDLAGKSVSLTGFVIPVKTSGKIITEFLLVPDIDTCPHAAPPPPNQVVLVTPEDGIVIKNRFNVVSVSGRIEASRDAPPRDGESGAQSFEAGYYIKDGKAEVIERIQ